MAQYVTQVTDPLAADTYGARYVFATLDQHQLALVTRVDWTFTPGLSLQLFAQPLLAAADFQDYKEFARPREFEFEVYGRDAGTISRDDATRTYTVDPDGPGRRRRSPSRIGISTDARCVATRCCGGSIGLARRCSSCGSRAGSGSIGTGEFDLGRDFNALWGVPPENVFVLKGTWWIGR